MTERMVRAAERKKNSMKTISQIIDSPLPRHKPEPSAIAPDGESRCDKTALSDEDLEQISAAGEATVPTANPEILLGRHDIPNDAEEHTP